VLHQIGAGASGPVFRAYEPELDKLVAVKVFALDLAPERTHQLVAELERLIAADLTHPAIAALLATGMSGNAAYLAQDFVGADALDIAVREHGVPPPADTVRIVTQVASALDSAASAGIFHGALHPRDVLVSPDDVRITGVGIWQALERVGVPVQVRRPYTAPERASGGSWDRRADVFGLGALAFELVFGRRVTGTGAQSLEGLSPIPGADRDQLSRVFARALAEEPADRFDTAGAFAEGLRFALGGALKGKRRAEVEPRLPLDAPTLVDLPLAAPRSLSAPSGDETIVLAVPAGELAAELPMVRAEPGRPPAEEPALAASVVPPDDRATPLPPVPSTPEAAKPPAPPPFVRSRPRGGGGSREARREPTMERSAPPPVPAMVPPPGPALMGATPREQSSVWPLALAGFMGVAVGFALGQVFPLRPGAADVSSAPAAANIEAPAAAPRDVIPIPLEPAPAAEIPPPAVAEPVSPPLPPSETIAAPTPSAAPAPVVVASAPPAPAVEGRLVIRSTPPGARVTVNGRAEGETPATVRGLEPGTYSVRVARAGFLAQERRVVISRGEPSATVAVTLSPETAPAPAPAARGTIQVESRPAGARVQVNGKSIGVTPLTVADLTAGDHVVVIEIDGYRRWQDTVRVAAGERHRVAASLEPQGGRN
jgi:serine/threonine-protein kinase